MTTPAEIPREVRWHDQRGNSYRIALGLIAFNYELRFDLTTTSADRGSIDMLFVNVTPAAAAQIQEALRRYLAHPLVTGRNAP